MADFRHEFSGRSPRSIAVLGGAVLLILVAWALFDLAPWITVLLFLFTLPIAVEVARNPRSRLVLSDTSLKWMGPGMRARLPLGEIEKVRFDTRLDFSVRVTVQMITGRKLRFPPDALPDHKVLEHQLQSRGVKTERHHFSLIG